MGQSYTRLYYHIIFSTKDRARQITNDFRSRLYEYLGGIIARENGRLIAAGGAADHVHLVVSLNATAALADVLRIVKTNSSKWVHETFPDKADFAWQPGYAAFSVSSSKLEDVRTYIANQEEHHRQTTFEEEFVAFLNRHGISYDRKYLWL